MTLHTTRSIRTDRPCIDCGTTIEDGDRYCMACGHVVETLADRLLGWKPNPNDRSLNEREYGAALAKKVRALLAPFRKDGVRVRTEEGYSVNVTIPHGRDLWDLGDNVGHHFDDLPYERQWHIIRYREAEARLRAILHRLYYDTAGIRDENPGADYPYQSLPILNINGY